MIGDNLRETDSHTHLKGGRGMRWMTSGPRFWVGLVTIAAVVVGDGFLLTLFVADDAAWWTGAALLIGLLLLLSLCWWTFRDRAGDAESGIWAQVLESVLGVGVIALLVAVVTAHARGVWLGTALVAALFGLGLLVGGRVRRDARSKALERHRALQTFRDKRAVLLAPFEPQAQDAAMPIGTVLSAYRAV